MWRWFIIMLCVTPLWAQPEWSAELSLDGFSFEEDGLSQDQERHGFSFALQPELYVPLGAGTSSLTITPFVRWDSRDDERSHWDLREFTWERAAQSWELRLGIRKVFWGVTESFHLVDVINQTDLVENFDGEEKLGQPMINIAWITDWGTIEGFALTGFRERSFPGAKGRLRAPLVVDDDLTSYESKAEETRIDWALRYAHSMGPFDVGASYFWGTSREPELRPDNDGDSDLVLQPHYPVIHQFGVDLQATLGPWLLKLETMHRQGFGAESYVAAVGGFEYTLGGVAGGPGDLGFLMEFLYDERGSATSHPFENDVFVGARFALNDVQSSELLMGVIIDTQGDGQFFNLEGERRLGQNWSARMELRAFSGTEPEDLLHGLRRDDHLRLELSRFF